MRAVTTVMAPSGMCDMQSRTSKPEIKVDVIQHFAEHENKEEEHDGDESEC